MKQDIKDTDAFLINLGTMQEDDGSFSAVVSMGGFKYEKDAQEVSEKLFGAVMKDIEDSEQPSDETKKET